MKDWKTIKSKTAFGCKYFKILEEDFILPSGKERKYYFLKTNDYVIVVAKNKEHFYLTEQYRYTTKSRLIHVVAGAIEKNKSPLMTAKKELEEEAGITAKKFKKLGWFYSNYGMSNQKAYVFLAEDLEFGRQKPDGLEKECNIKIKKFKIAEIEKMIRLGEINDHDTLSAFCLFMLKC